MDIALNLNGSEVRLPLRVGRQPAQAARWEAGADGLAFDVGATARHLLFDYDEAALMRWLGEPDQIRNLAVRLDAIEGSFAHEPAVVLRFVDGAGEVLQTMRIPSSASGEAQTFPFKGTPAGLRISVRVTGEGRFLRSALHLRVEGHREPLRAVAAPATVPAPANDTGGGAPAAGHEPDEEARTRPAAIEPNWLRHVPPDLRADLCETLLEAKTRSLRRLMAGLDSEMRDLNALVEQAETLDVFPGPTANALLTRAAVTLDTVTIEVADAARTMGELEARAQALRPLVAGVPEKAALKDLARIPAAGNARADIAEAAAEIALRSGLRSAIASCFNSAPLAEHGPLIEALGVALSMRDVPAAVRCFWLAWAMKPTPERARTLSSRMFKAGDVNSSARLLDQAPAGDTSGFVNSMHLARKLTTDGLEIPPRRRGAVTPVDDLAYVASSAQPIQIAGYTIRTHQLLASLRRAGLSVTCYLRPGYPWDNKKLAEAGNFPPERYQVGDVDYVLSRIDGAKADPSNHIEQMAESLLHHFVRRPPGVVQAASNYRNALPALIAARRIGVPFIYEVRGLWELTAASKIEHWDQTERFTLDRNLELLVARSADQVLAITNGVRDELARGGVPVEKIELLTNAVDPEAFRPLPVDTTLVARHGLTLGDFVIVYAGSLTVYEGLDDVIAAVGLLRQEGLPVRFLIVGDGGIRPDLEAQVKKLGLGEQVTFVGRVTPDQVERYISLASVLPIPRKPFRVCEIVSPLKPFEAMAMAKVTVLSNLRALTDIVQDGFNGLICKPADPVDLARVLKRLHTEPGLAEAIGARARTWVVEHRSWNAHAQRLHDLYGRLRAPAVEQRTAVPAL